MLDAWYVFVCSYSELAMHPGACTETENPADSEPGFAWVRQNVTFFRFESESDLGYLGGYVAVQFQAWGFDERAAGELRACEARRYYSRHAPKNSYYHLHLRHARLL